MTDFVPTRIRQVKVMKFAICHELYENCDWETQCGLIAETIRGTWPALQLFFKSQQALAHPMAIPSVLGVFIDLERAREVLQHPQIVQRISKSANFSADLQNE